MPTHEVLLQPVSIAYTHIQGIAMGRQHRPLVAWYGDMDFGRISRNSPCAARSM